MAIHDMRKEYDHGALLESEADADAIRQFAKWFEQARSANVGPWYEPNAMTLATVSPDGQPTARIVLLKGFDDSGFTFFTNYDSAKAGDITHDARVALVFHWANLERQVRIEGVAHKTSTEESQHYFRSRPRGSQLGALASCQSKPAASRSELEKTLADLEARYAHADVPMPENWGGYRVVPSAIEFWQGRPNRLHDRLRYTRVAPLQPGQAPWQVQRLWP
ncbi:MAG: pyridoxamine 5'-phosphate oxidase [Phycisphaera sp.]|nr:pyridoxamine 5'-phosphate oxidase [Phycisphaera sp.]